MTISVFLADDNLIVREGVRALLNREPDLEVVGVAAKELRKRHPGTGVVILSQYDDPEYAISLLSDGAAGDGYLLKDRLAEGDQLVQAVRAVASGGTALDPAIVNALVTPVTAEGELSAADEDLLRLVAEGKPIKAIAVTRRTTPEAVAEEVERLFLKLAQGASTGGASSLRLRLLHQAIVDREEQGETLSRLLPGSLAEKLRRDGRHIGESEAVVVTVLMRGGPPGPVRPSPTRTSPPRHRGGGARHRRDPRRAAARPDGGEGGARERPTRTVGKLAPPRTDMPAPWRPDQHRECNGHDRQRKGTHERHGD